MSYQKTRKDDEPKKTLLKIAEKLETVLSKSEIERIAREEKFVQRERNLAGLGFLGLSINGVGSSGFCSLTEQLTDLLKSYGISITKKGLNDRFNEYGVAFIKRILGEVLKLSLSQQLDIGKLDFFKAVYIKDATGNQLPECYAELFKGSGGSASKSGLKVDFWYDILSDGMDMALRDGASNDSNSPLTSFGKGNLYLWDLGYYWLDTFEKVINAGSFFISRNKTRTKVYQDFVSEDGTTVRKVVELKELTKGMRVNQIKDFEVYLGLKKQLKVRMVIQKLPKKVADQRKRKVRKSSKNTPSKERLLHCEYTIIITNIDQDKFTGEEILKIYGIRWQIEILFKGWKSVMEFGRIHPMKKHRFLCMLYGHLIWIALTMKIVSWFKIIFWNSYQIELSELKAFKIIRIYQHDLLAILSKDQFGCFQFNQFIQSIRECLFLFAEKEIKKNMKKKCSINLFSMS